jgi:transposase
MERLHVKQIRDVIYRLRQGESQRQIAQDLQMSRHTIARYRELAESHGYLDPARLLPSDRDLRSDLGSPKSPPRCDSTVTPYREIVERLIVEKVEMVAIFARLRDDHGYSGSYSSIRRFVRRIAPKEPDAFIRVHTAPGEEAQVDFGSVGRMLDPKTGRCRSAYSFVMTLSHSRHQYVEFVFDQKVVTWIACHRHALEWFGGAPRKIVPDNLKAAVLQASLNDVVLGDAYRRMAQHYGFLISPTRPAMPEHKGKVESGVHYVERNFVAGQDFPDVDVANRRVRVWVTDVAGVREHGTTHQPPYAVFVEREKKALLALPTDPFELLDIRQAKLHRDCHVTLDGSFYSAPYRYIGQVLDAYIGERVVELFDGVELVATHLKAFEKGEWRTRIEHYPPDKAEYLERSPERCREIARGIGFETAKVVEALLSERPLDRLRSVQQVLRLADEHGRGRLEAACRRALYYGDSSYRRIKEILKAGLDLETLPPLPTPIRSADRPVSGSTNGRGSGGGYQSYAHARDVREFLPPYVGIDIEAEVESEGMSTRAWAVAR